MKAFGSQILAELINCKAPILAHADTLAALLKKGILKYKLELKTINSYQFEPIGVTAIAIIGESHVALHTYPEENHVSLDIFTCSPGSEGPRHLVDFFKQALEAETVRIQQVYRGQKIEIEAPDAVLDFTAGPVDIRYPVVEEIFSQRTAYQYMRIIKNAYFGRMLFLDHQLQIAESDAQIYNQALVQPLEKAAHPLNKVAILGGGDGGVLAEVLKLNPRQVYLVDIDAAVIAAAETYLPHISRGAFQDPRTQIVISDAASFIHLQTDFDAIIHDLTLAPEVMAQLERKPYFEKLFAASAHSLCPGGVISVQVGSDFDRANRAFILALLEKYFVQVQIQTIMIPSFCETWIFASATKSVNL